LQLSPKHQWHVSISGNVAPAISNADFLEIP
jgi:hypothetical protein